MSPTTTPTGRLIIVSAPSGAGKSTIVRALMASGLNLSFSVSACNRPPRGKELHGREYYFLSTEEFLNKIEKGDFLEWEEVYPGRYYGTLRPEVDTLLSAGQNVIFDVDVYGGLKIKKAYGERALSIFIMPPSVEELEQRLRIRSTESEEELKIRLGKAKQEMNTAEAFDIRVVNQELKTAIAEITGIVRSFIQQN